MCDYYFWRRMEKSKGDLTDIFQGSRFDEPATDTWQSTPDPTAALSSVSGTGFVENFEETKDLMLHELAGTGFFGSVEKAVTGKTVSSKSGEVTRTPVPQLATLTDGVHIASPRTQGIKRRKNQARKVVCIPAPAVASNKSGGEVVPSDLWAWRKYGQKPIKGSPYPRGYYRCSSSKGCSARKQVERSRTDPNMLVITYTSDHNHPWPTQRNSLSGSTRSQSSKNNNNNASSSKSSSSINQIPPAHENITKREEEEIKGSPTSSSFPLVKEMSEIDFNESDDFFADLAILDEEKNYMFGWDGGNLFEEKSCRNKLK